MNIDLSIIDHEDLEFLVADLLKAEGFTIESGPSRGPDRGKDLLAVRYKTCDIGFYVNERILVECKHFYKSGKSVKESDIGYFENKLKTHNANRYLLVTSSVVSETVKNHIEATSQDFSSGLNATYWAKNDLIERISNNKAVYKKYFTSWDKEAEEAVSYVNNHLYSAHMGAMLWTEDVSIVFGNDGYKSPKVKERINLLRKELHTKNIKELSFSISDKESSWVMVVNSKEAEKLHDIIWGLAKKHHDPIIVECQRNKAFSLLVSYFSEPHKQL